MPNYRKEILIETQEIGYQNDTVSKQEIRTSKFYHIIFIHIRFYFKLKLKFVKWTPYSILSF